MIENHIGKEAYQDVLDRLSGNQEFIETSAAYIEDFLIQLDDQNMIEDNKKLIPYAAPSSIKSNKP